MEDDEQPSKEDEEFQAAYIRAYLDYSIPVDVHLPLAQKKK
jgi:hypothetical protein